MRKELEKLTTKQLIKLVKTFEHYPAVTLKDGKDYILSYLEDEACTISEEKILEYLFKNSAVITNDNIHLYYMFMNDEDLKKNMITLGFIFNSRFTILKNTLFIVESEINWIYYVRTNFNGYILGQTFFDVKDILKPLDEYIADIKNHEAYKSYIAKVS